MSSSVDDLIAFRRDLLAFLRARFDEDEQIALAAVRKHEDAVETVARHDSAATWSSGSDESESGDYRHAVWAGDGAVTICEMLDEYDEATATHIARHDPARVLRDVEARRRILDEHAHIPDDGINFTLAEQARAEDTIKLLALPYADVDGYREEWKP